ncbi:MAG TPA: lysophospholipid acyltransferase family protein [Terriglobales bacterium]|nr:lysophospholipid acyltransferase family protein [Terriglobales bacterium]
MTGPAPSVAADEPASEPRFPLRQRVLLPLIAWAGALLVRLLCATVRYRNSAEPGGPLDANERPMIWAFWHRCLILATHRFQKRDIAVLTSRSFDGEIISRIIEKFGYYAVRGSSRRGALGAVLGARRELEAGRAVAFTVDGPLGPLYEAKPGPVVLSRLTGVQVIAFHIALEHAWTLGTWDRMLVPKPFSRAFVHFSAPMLVPAGSDEVQMEGQRRDLQMTLEHVRDIAEAKIKASRQRTQR